MTIQCSHQQLSIFQTPPSPPKPPRGCCHSRRTRNCCAASAVLGVLSLGLGAAALLLLEPFLERKIEESMAITPDSERLAGWLKPPLQAGICSQNSVPNRLILS